VPLGGPAGFDRDHVWADRADGQRRRHPGVHVAWAEVAVQQQHLDQRPRAVPVAECLAGSSPECLVRRGDSPGRAGLDQGGGAGHRAGLARQDL
jgi:hypothetical protein